MSAPAARTPAESYAEVAGLAEMIAGLNLPPDNPVVVTARKTLVTVCDAIEDDLARVLSNANRIETVVSCYIDVEGGDKASVAQEAGACRALHAKAKAASAEARAALAGDTDLGACIRLLNEANQGQAAFRDAVRSFLDRSKMIGEGPAH